MAVQSMYSGWPLALAFYALVIYAIVRFLRTFLQMRRDISEIKEMLGRRQPPATE